MSTEIERVKKNMYIKVFDQDRTSIDSFANLNDLNLKSDQPNLSGIHKEVHDRKVEMMGDLRKYFDYPRNSDLKQQVIRKQSGGPLSIQEQIAENQVSILHKQRVMPTMADSI